MLAMVCVVGGRWVARVMVASSAFWLGLGGVASVQVAGVTRTVQLLVPHAPLEAVAWVATLATAERTWPMLRTMWVAARSRDVGFCSARVARWGCWVAGTIVLYLMAALAEGWEIARIWG